MSDERDVVFQEKHARYADERARILDMLDSGKITAAEGERLFEALERETATRACPYCSEDIRVEAVKCKHCGAFLVAGMKTGPKRLRRSRDKMLAGICAGLAEYLDLDVSLVRILIAVIVLFSGIIAGVVIYLIAALVIPEAEPGSLVP